MRHPSVHKNRKSTVTLINVLDVNFMGDVCFNFLIVEEL